ncbi:MAG TPA: hypothetical protein DCL08_06445 [Anaerolineaceae bacterium]|nr:hypothetical protein [Anaerolineaceae bacterium]
MAQRRRRGQIPQEEGRNLRAAVEAAVRRVKHPSPGGKLPVRGQFRVSCMILGSAIMGNIRRIQRFQKAKLRLEIEERERKEQIRTQKDTEQTAHDSFFPFFNFPKLSFSRI